MTAPAWTVEPRSELYTGETWQILDGEKIIATAYSAEVAAVIVGARDMLARLVKAEEYEDDVFNFHDVATEIADEARAVLRRSETL